VELLQRNQTIPVEDYSPRGVDFPARQQHFSPALVASSLSSLSVASNDLRGSDEAPRAPHAIASSTATSNSILPKGPFCTLTNQAASDLRHSDNTSLVSHAAGTNGVSELASSQPSPSATSADIPLETEEELQNVLDTYRTKMFQFFPVVILGPEITVEYMAAKRPMVWLVLRTICSKKLTRQLALYEETKRLISSKLVVEGERSFDMLVALVLYANWGWFFCAKANSSPSLHLAMALAGDLGLTKSNPPAVITHWTQTGSVKPVHASMLKTRTMEERRVVLGLFLVSSV
jgi:hypothetical protein